jgi:predicted XRE-type DNA-binding protein
MRGPMSVIRHFQPANSQGETDSRAAEQHIHFTAWEAEAADYAHRAAHGADPTGSNPPYRAYQIAPAGCGGALPCARRQRRAQAMTKRKIEAYEGSGNVFADLGLPNPEERLLKSSIVTELHRLIKARNLTQVKAAKLIGISQPDLSHLLRGDYDDYSAERLMKMLTMFEQDIEIVMRPHRKAGEPGRITFKPVAA